jgi:hypothetical protein
MKPAPQKSALAAVYPDKVPNRLGARRIGLTLRLKLETFQRFL